MIPFRWLLINSCDWNVRYTNSGQHLIPPCFVSFSAAFTTAGFFDSPGLIHEQPELINPLFLQPLKLSILTSVLKMFVIITCLHLCRELVMVDAVMSPLFVSPAYVSSHHKFEEK